MLVATVAGKLTFTILGSFSAAGSGALNVQLQSGDASAGAPWPAEVFKISNASEVISLILWRAVLLGEYPLALICVHWKQFLLWIVHSIVPSSMFTSRLKIAQKPTQICGQHTQEWISIQLWRWESFSVSIWSFVTSHSWKRFFCSLWIWSELLLLSSVTLMTRYAVEAIS